MRITRATTYVVGNPWKNWLFSGGGVGWYRDVPSLAWPCGIRR